MDWEKRHLVSRISVSISEQKNESGKKTKFSVKVVDVESVIHIEKYILQVGG